MVEKGEGFPEYELRPGGEDGQAGLRNGQRMGNSERIAVPHHHAPNAVSRDP